MADNDGISSKRPPRWLRGWRLLVTMAVMGLFLVVLTLMTAVMLSGNLKPVIERAKKDGLPTTWDELGLVVNPQHAVLLSRIDALVTATKAYGSVSITVGKGSYSLGTPGIELPEGFYAQIRGRSIATQNTMAELLGLMHEPIRPLANPTVHQWSRVYSLYKIIDLETERLLALSKPTEQDFFPALAACRSFGPDSLYHVYFRRRALYSVGRAIRFHLPHLAGRSSALAGIVRLHARELDEMLGPASRGEFVRNIAVLQMDPMTYANLRLKKTQAFTPPAFSSESSAVF